jgi:endonuclease/exonuclease/phosphatase family metal-dependent hydrolase
MASDRMRIASYNIGDYTGRGFERGSEEGILAIRAAMAAVGADLWGLQEDVCCYGDKTGAYPYGVVYEGYSTYVRRGSNRYNYKAFLTNCEVYDVEQVRYVGDTVFNHPWFLSGKIRIGDKEITVISLHLDWQDKDTRREQRNQIINYVKDRKYAIIIGDFNPCDYENGVKISPNGTYDVDFPHFASAGLNLANCAQFGAFHTYLDTPYAPCPLDNIITTPAIKIVNAGVRCEEWMYDHAILWADIEID